MAAAWYAIQTHPHNEGRALLNLLRQGFDAYLPRYLKRRRHAGKTEQVEAPLFPRYLFLRADSDGARWRSIRSTFGVADVVALGGTPTPVPEPVIEEIRAREDKEGLVRLEDTLKPGQEVRIATGAFAELSGLFQRMADDSRAIVLLQLLGRTLSVRVASRGLEPVR